MRIKTISGLYQTKFISEDMQRVKNRVGNEILTLFLQYTKGILTTGSSFCQTAVENKRKVLQLKQDIFFFVKMVLHHWISIFVNDLSNRAELGRC